MFTGKDVSGKEALNRLDEEIDLGTVNEFFEELYSDIENKKLIEKEGYDGIVAEMGRDGKRIIKEYVAFSPKQIKTKPQLTALFNQAKGTSPRGSKRD